MVWDIRNDLPIHSQLLAQLKLAIVSGDFRPGERLPSVRDMAMEAGVNPNTMQRALQELEREGLVYSMRTAGRFVTEETVLIENAKKQLARAKVESFIESMARLGYGREALLSLLEEGIKEDENVDS